MAAFVIFDIAIAYAVRYEDFMRQVKPRRESAGARWCVLKVSGQASP
jgi:hypothetical protein